MLYLVSHFFGLLFTDFLRCFCPKHWYNISVERRVVIYVADVQRLRMDLTRHQVTAHNRVDLDANDSTKCSSAERLNVNLTRKI